MDVGVTHPHQAAPFSDRSADLPARTSERPLIQLPKATLIDALGQDYFNAQVCKAALHAFAAENEARMQAMTSAGSQPFSSG